MFKITVGYVVAQTEAEDSDRDVVLNKFKCQI